jgi:hypothetical protein
MPASGAVLYAPLPRRRKRGVPGEAARAMPDSNTHGDSPTTPVAETAARQPAPEKVVQAPGIASSAAALARSEAAGGTVKAPSTVA